MVIFGLFDRVFYRDDKTGYTIFSLKVSERVKERNPHFGTITACGNLVTYAPKTPMRLEGNWKETKKGFVFECSGVREEAETKESAIEYLCSISGIGPQRAESLIKAVGIDFQNKLKGSDGPKIVMNACKVNLVLAEEVCAKINASRAERELYEYLVSVNGTYRTAAKMFKELGLNAMKVLKGSPYRVGAKFGLSFQQCDEIALMESKPRFDKDRLFSAMITALKKAEQGGDVYMNFPDFLQLAQNIAGNDGQVPSSLFASVAFACPDIIIEKDSGGMRVYRKQMKKLEYGIAENIVRINNSSKPLPFDESIVDQVESEVGVKYAVQQREAFNVLNKTGISVITGGPGTGKTTVINGIIRAYKRICPDGIIKCCAPTGRASQRMKESTGEEAVTVHRLLEYRPFGNDVSHKDISDPIQADFIIMDESSMLDTEIANIFLSAVKNGTLVLFVGDVDQLQAVGAGDVLHSLIFSGCIDVHRLTDVYRQAIDSPIVQNAISINFGETDLISNDDDFQIKYMPAASMQSEIVKLVKKYHNPADPFSTQVLAPSHRGSAGIKELNNILQEILNPRVQGRPERVYGYTKYRENDKVVLLSNNYASHYHNGDIGIVTAIDGDALHIKLCDDSDIVVSGDGMEDVNLAYAMTVHKSQGSEFKTVILALPYIELMLKRNLLYTGITRAKKRVVIVSEPGAIDKSIATDETGKRNTRLKEELQVLSYGGEL